MNKIIEVTEEFIEEQYARVPKPEGIGLFEACSDDICLFAEYMLGIKLYAWQIYTLKKIQRAVEGKSSQRDFCALTSRQIGKSTLLQILAIWVCLFNKRPVGMHSQTVVAIVSASDKQAKKLIRKTRQMMYAGERFMHRQYDGNFTDGDGKFFSALWDPNSPNNTETITFKPHNSEEHGEFLLAGSGAGSFIESHPPTSGVLGETVSFIFIDEAGKYQKISDEFYYEEISPIGDRADAIRFNTSTPWAPVGFFFELCDPDGENGSPAEVFAFTIDALKHEPDEGAQKQYESVMKRIDEMRAQGQNDSVKRSYYCEFVKGDTSFFDPEAVKGAFPDDYDMIQERYEGEVDIGIDFGGRVSSRTVITVTRISDSGVIQRLWHKRYGVKEDNEIMHDLQFQVFPLFPKWQRIIVDDCPQADYIIREMKDKGWPVTEMLFRTEKLKKFSAFRAMLSKGLVQSYTDPVLKQEMFAFEQTEGARTTRISAPKGETDDMIDSFVMSAYHMVSDESRFKVVSWDDWDEVEENNKW